MRTKTLLLTAAFCAAGVASAMAQVYSVNAVGYVNTTVPPGYNLIANPLDAGNNSISNVLAGVPEGTIVYTYTAAGGFTLNTLDFGEWTNPNETLEPGKGFFLRNTGTANFTVTFVGEVKQGTLTTPLVVGYNLVASQVPQAGGIQTDLGLVPAEGDQVYVYANPTGYTIYTFDFGAWDPSQPNLAVGQGVFVRKQAAGSWTRTFSVN
jgi:hypothetical protein